MAALRLFLSRTCPLVVVVVVVGGMCQQSGVVGGGGEGGQHLVVEEVDMTQATQELASVMTQAKHV